MSSTINRVKITDSLIRKKLPTELKSILRDSELIGLQVIRVTKHVISFRYQFRLNGKRGVITLGHFPAITSHQARELAKANALLVADGINPLLKKQAKREDSKNTLQLYIDTTYRKYMRGHAKHADRYVNIIIKAFPDLLDKPIAEISKSDLTDWVLDQKENHMKGVSGYASATIVQRFSTLKGLMSYALRNDVIKANPFDKVERLEFSHASEATAQQANRTYLDLGQQARLLKAIDDTNRNTFHPVMLKVLYYTGMRTGDVVSLEWSHIIGDDIVKVLEKTDRKVKTPTIIPINRKLKPVLLAWRMKQGNPKAGLVFPNKRGLRRHRGCMNNYWKQIKEKAGLATDLHLYTLRHNFISWLVMKGNALSYIAAIVGHTNTNTIQAHYSHLIEGESHKVAESFASLTDDIRAMK